jgi:hypothetical protein
VGGVRFAIPAADGQLTIGSEPMDEDTTGMETPPKRNDDFSEYKYKLDTYDEDDDGPASSASGHALFGITAICPTQLLVLSPT